MHPFSAKAFYVGELLLPAASMTAASYPDLDLDEERGQKTVQKLGRLQT